MPNKAMMFAAGFGTRMGSMTASTPKPLIPVCDKPLIDHALDLCDAALIETTLVNVHYLANQIETHLGNRNNVKTILETPDILETGGGLKNALPILGNDPVFTLNSDAIWTGENPLNALRQAWVPEYMDALLMLIPTENAQEHFGEGDFLLTGAGAIQRRGSAPSAPFVYSGIQIIKTDGLADITETAFSLNLLWDEMITKGTLFGTIHHGGWVDVGRPEGITAAETLLECTDRV